MFFFRFFLDFLTSSLSSKGVEIGESEIDL